ncbi:hypothetical protein [Nocardiopsis synnemataformans]|uniref:hypothetical protein n=1 Tax=Nocardiopsis synnemataformans TaxID=61305 RepID=UPI003EB973F6
MAQPLERIQDALSDRQSPAERDKLVRRLPPDSGLDAIGVRMPQQETTALRS